MSDTPETDQASRECHGMPNPGLFVSIKFARQLERERDEARRIAERWQRYFIACRDMAAEIEAEVKPCEALPWQEGGDA